MKYISFGAFVAIALSVSGAAAQTFTIDTSQSRVGFESIKYVNTHVKGSFNRYTGTFNYNEQDPTKSYVQVTVETCSFDTTKGNSGITALEAKYRDKDVTETPSFLDCHKYPAMTFKSTQIFSDGDSPGTMKIVGDLTLKGVTHPVTLKVEKMGESSGSSGEKVMKFAARTTINRKDFGVDGGATATALDLRDSIDLDLNVVGIAQPEASDKTLVAGSSKTAPIIAAK